LTGRDERHLARCGPRSKGTAILPNEEVSGFVTQGEIHAASSVRPFPVRTDLLDACRWSQPDHDGFPASKLKIRRNAIRRG